MTAEAESPVKVTPEKLQPEVVLARAPGAVVHLVVFAAAATAAFFIYGLIA